MIRRILIAGVAALGAFSISLAFAASLGGLSPDNLGADSSAVSSCDTDGVTTSYDVAYDATDEVYEVATVTVGGINDACDGMTLSVTVAAADGTVLASESVTIPSAADTAEAVTLTNAVSAVALENVHVAIS